MTRHPLRCAALLICMATHAAMASAAPVQFNTVFLNSFARFNNVADSDPRSAPSGVGVQSESLVDGLFAAFPGIPSSVGSGFVSAAVDNAGNFGVGVHSFFNSAGSPPQSMVAVGSFSTSFTNVGSDPTSVLLDFFVPPPNIQIVGQGVGDFFPSGVDPARDTAGAVNVKLQTVLTRADGAVIRQVLLDYGMRIVRDPATGIQSAIGTGDGFGQVTRFDVDLDQRDFQLPGLTMQDLQLPSFANGDVFEVRYDFEATASIGFGETGVFAAIGDPFALDTGGARLSMALVPSGTLPPLPVPEPGTAALLGAGLLALVWRRGAGAAVRPRSIP